MKKGVEPFPLFVAGNFDKIIFENCTVEGEGEPAVWIATEGEVELINSTPITVKKVTREECIEVRPWGIPAEYRKK